MLSRPVSTLDALLGEATPVGLTQPLGQDTVRGPGSAPLAVSVELTRERDGA